MFQKVDGIFYFCNSLLSILVISIVWESILNTLIHKDVHLCTFNFLDSIPTNGTSGYEALKERFFKVEGFRQRLP